MDTFTSSEREYLASQTLGRLATVDRHAAPQNSPVGFLVRDDGTIVIGGFRLGTTRKFANAARHDRVSLVIDDLASVDPWRARGVEVRGRAEVLTDADPAQPWMSREQIHIHPERIISWGLEEPAVAS